MTEATFIDGDEKAIFHVGTKRHSGRYPWGSGENPGQRNRSFLMEVDMLKKKGLSEKEIADGFGLTMKQLRDNKAIAKHEIKQELVNKAIDMRDNRQMSNVAIGEALNMNESSVRALLSASTKEKMEKLDTLTNTVRSAVDEKRMVDIGSGVEAQLGVSRERLSAAVTKLQSEGYNVYPLQVDQMNGKKTNMKVLAAPDVPYSDVYKRQGDIDQIMAFTTDKGKSFDKIQPPLNIDLDRVGVRYGPDGGAEMDGVIHVRRGVDDISLGNSRYAQVRIGVGGTHYLKGMAIYNDDLPPGVDLMFNTNKTNTGNKLDAMKPQKVDKETGKVDQSNPFGSIVKQQFVKDKDGNDVVDPKTGTKKVKSAMNIVYEEGDWDKWSKSISSQVLSKQSSALAKRQLALRADEKRAEFEEIMSLTNPAVKRKLLNSLADDLDSSAVHLKAAALPRQRTQVILPINKMKEDEIYAPNFNNGEKVVLIRYPHGGRFEIPELTVNNRNRPAIEPIKGAKDAVGIHSKVAERLSGADFDGDTVLVIPNSKGAIKTAKALKDLEGFDAKKQYSLPEGVDGIRGMKNPTGYTQRIMGDISNLITDMTIIGATEHELARAVKHSMVAIDAQKHNLDYKQSAKDNQISELKRKYQGGPRAGASTLISQSKGQAPVIKRKQWNPSVNTIDPRTGEKIRKIADDAMLKDKDGNPLLDKNGEVRYKTEKSTKMAETKDAFSLVSNRGNGQPIEVEYALHANKLKGMANEARLAWINTPPQTLNASARKAYAPEIRSLDDKLNLALRNKPLERQAQVFANVTVRKKLEANPDMDKAEIKKLKSLAQEEARNRVGARKTRIVLTPIEWNAIQAGAISNHKLEQLLDNMDDKDIKALATPREKPAMTPANLSRAKGMLNADFTRAEVAEALGVSVTTLNNVLNEGD
jgi:hypothetical protein